jgi:signal transduction histidine kinase
LFNLHVKLILVVLVIIVTSFATVVFTNIEIVRIDKRKSLEFANRQISEMISKSVVFRMREYHQELQRLAKAFASKESFQIDSDYFPDHIWISMMSWDGDRGFEWMASDRLSRLDISPDRLLGKMNENSLIDEVKQVLNRSDEWVLYNSTIDPFLPTFLLVSSFKPFDDQPPTHVILAEISADALFNQLHPKEGQELLLIDTNLNILYSSRESWDPTRIALNDNAILSRIKRLNPGSRVMETLPYQDREAQLTWIHRLHVGQGLTLVLQEPASNLLTGLKEIQWKSFIVGIFVVSLAITLIALFASQITSPLKNLISLMERAGKGEFSGRIKVKSKDEIGKLAKVFNKMLGDLIDRDHQIENAKEKLIQSEKMSAFGQMSAGIAHEVKNPLAGILGYTQIAKKKVEGQADILNYLEIIEKETHRCKEIVENLMKFARQEKAVLSRVDLNKTVKESVRLVEHQLSVAGIKIVQSYAEDSKPVFIQGNSNQLQQVMLNLMLNAQHAMENHGTLTIETLIDGEKQIASVAIKDTGCGMTEEVKNRIFEPFFTTKGVGKGTGLGLSVTIGIIKDHQGVIEVDSEVGKGTTFRIVIPLDNQADGSDEKKVEAA